VPEFGRNYPNQSLASHVLGYVGLDNVGLDGVEYSFNEELSPAAVGRADAPQEELFGNQVFLSIDRDIQHLVERRARQAFTDNQADAVLILAMEAGSGEILAYAAVPDFDPNQFNNFARSTLRNLPLAQAYEPGSVFKIFSIASFLQLGGIQPEDSFTCTGLYEKHLADGETIRIRDLTAHGRVNAGLILKYSCNVGAAYASEKVQREDFYRILQAFGFGRPTGLPLPGESAGILAPPSRWSLRTKATIAFGQEISVSALQVMQAATAIANGGLLLAPRIVTKILSPTGQLVKEFGRQPLREVVSPQVAREVLEMMATATDENGGTARRGRVEGVRISAKTGTAQVRDPATGTYSESNYVASYLGIFPTEQPRIILYVVLHNPKGPAYYGSQIAAPVFRGVAEDLIGYLGIPRRGDVVLEQPGSLRVAVPPALVLGESMPDLRGTPKRLLLPLLAVPGLEVRISGDGFVVEQDPPPGTRLEAGTGIRLRLE
jgi:cell division protein FtsI (penicillin-binding protein 3)